MYSQFNSCFSRKTGIPTLVSAAVGAICLFSATAHADIIYRETFGLAPGATVDAFATVFDWQRFDNNGAAITTTGSSSGVNFTVNGRPIDVANISAGPNNDGTFGAYANGILYLGATPSPSLTFTPEFSFNPNNYVPGSIVFSWYEGNNTAPHTFRLLVRVGGRWYASATSFVTAAVTLANFGTQAELKTLTYDPAAANWLQVNFDGDFVLGPTPGTGITTPSTLGALALGAAPSSDLSGAITAVGVYSDNGGSGTGNRRIDTFTIQATPASTGAGKNVTWTGSNDGDWDTVKTNWKTNGSSAIYVDGDAARFDDSVPGTVSINLIGLLLPGSVTVSNNTAAYVFGGSGALAGGGGLLKQGTGTLTLSSGNTYSGGTTISNGTLRVGDGGGTGSLGSGNVTNFGALVFNRTNNLTFTNVVSGTGSLSQDGGGTLTIGGTQTHSGTTMINAGTLLVNGVLNGGGVVTNAANTTLGGNGTNTGPVNVSGVISPGTSLGTLTVGGLTMFAGATATFELNSTNTVAGGVNDLIQVNGNLTLNNNTVLINLLAPPQTGVPYRLVNYTGTAAGNFNPTVAVAGGSRYTVTLSHDTVAKQVNVTFGGGPASLKWNDSSSGAWDVGTTTNWLKTPGNQPDVFLVFDSVLFDDTVGLQTSVDVSAGNVTPTVITNDSSVNAFTISGTSRITGSGRIVKKGTSTLIVNTTNDFSGGVIVQAGTVRLGNVNAGGTGLFTVNSNGTFVAGGAHTNAITLAGGIFGTSAAMNPTTMEVTVAPGTTSTLYMADPDNLSGPADGTEVNFTGAWHGSGNVIVATVLNDTSPDGGNGFRLRGTTASDYSGTITLSNRVKGELQTGVAGPFSPAGTGTIIMYGGTLTANTLNGDFSELNLRNNATAATVLGNNIVLAGTGLVVLNPLGSAPANTTITLGNLKIGAGQECGVNLNGTGPDHRIVFTSVTLTGGNATFSPKTPGWNTTPQIASDLSLGTITQQVAGSGIIMTGLRTLYLTGTNTYTGSTLISNGVVSLIGTASITTSSNIFIETGALLSATGRVDRTLTLASGQTLSGIGSVEGNVTVSPGAIISPGSSVGQLAISNNLVLQGTAAIEIDKAQAQQDQIVGATNITYGGTLALSFVSGAGTLTTADSFKLFDAASYGGSFASIVPANPGSGLAWDTSTLATDGTLRVKVGGSAPPQIGSVFVSGGNIVFTGSGGTPGGSYSVLISTNVTLSVASWPTQGSGVFDASGNFGVTNAIGLGIPQQFFRLKLP